MSKHRWIVVTDCEFLPAARGGEQEQLGFIKSCLQEGSLALLVVPVSNRFHPGLYAELLGDVPVLTLARRLSPVRLAHPTKPYVIASRPISRDAVRKAMRLAPDATGVVILQYKSHDIGHKIASATGLPAALRQQNREGDYHRRLAEQASGPRRFALAWDARRIARDELRLNRADWLVGTADISRADAEWRRSAGGRNVVHIPPFALGGLGREATGLAREPVEGRILFLGSLDAETNTGGLDWFLRQVWPRVKAARPEAGLDVVGRNPDQGLRRRLQEVPDVELFADVPAVEPFVARAAVAVNPIVSGSGFNIKLLDYFREGVPVVSTSIATQGLPLTPEEDLLIRDDPHDFADAVIGLLRDADLREQVGRTGQQHLSELVDVRRNLRDFTALFERAAASAGSDTPQGDRQ